MVYLHLHISEPHDIFSFNIISFVAIDAEFTGLHTTDGSQPRYCIMNIEPLFVHFQEGKCKKKSVWGSKWTKTGGKGRFEKQFKIMETRVAQW